MRTASRPADPCRGFEKIDLPVAEIRKAFTPGTNPTPA